MLMCVFCSFIRNKACIVYDGQEQDSSLNIAADFKVPVGDLFSVQILSVNLECFVKKRKTLKIQEYFFLKQSYK